MNPTSTVSLVVMTYERPAALRRCLTSIRRLDYPASAYELIVVDDGSAPQNSSPLEQFCPHVRRRYQWIPHQGVSAARNTGLALAHGDRIAFLADDYVLPADYLSQADSFFQNYPEAQVLTFNVKSVGSSPARHVQQLYHDLVLLQNAGAMPDENGIIKTSTLPASRAAIFKKGVFDRVGPFNENLKAGEDGELGQRLAARAIPVYFMHKYYIDHYEEKDFREFLEQRKAYATSYYKVSRLAERTSVIHKPRWTLGRCIQIVSGKIVAWAGLSWKYGKFLRFFFLWPGLALFLFRFYVTLHRLERIDFHKAILRRVKRTLIDRIRKYLHELTRVRCFRILALSVIRLLCFFASLILRGSGFVESVFVRGSYARGNFLPFLSDIDLAIVVKCRPDDNDYEVFQSLHRRLRLVRMVNPFVRDVWQVIVTEREWSLIAKYAYLFGISEWRLLSGRQPQLSNRSINKRLLLASYWNRQHYWTNLALQQALRRQNSVRGFPSSLKKARFYAAKLSGEPFLRTHPEPTSHDILQELSQSLVDLDRSSEFLVNTFGLKNADKGLQEDGVEVNEPSEKDVALVREISGLFDVEENFDFIFCTGPFLIFIPNEKWRREEYYQALSALERIYQATGNITCVYSWASFSLALFTDPIRVLYTSQGESKSRNGVLSSLLLKEQMAYEALYSAINIRVALARPDSARALELHLYKILKALSFFMTGTLHREDPPSLQNGLTQIQSLDPILSSRLTHAYPLHELSSRDRTGAKYLFEVASVLCERLFEVIDRSDFNSCPGEA